MSETPNTDHPQEGRRTRQNTAKTRRNSQGRVFTYLAILFAAAFFLLLLAYFMQQRANRETIDGLTESMNQSVTSIHSLQNLVDVNESLEAENKALKTEVESLKESLEQSQKESDILGKKAEEAETANRAMDWFWQVDEAYVLGRYGKCRELMTEMEEQDLVSCLPTESVTNNGRFSPAARYQEIHDKLY